MRLRLGAAASPLAISLLTAIALHLLALSALQLRERRKPIAAMPPPRDDSPELLQFSRQQTREPALAPLSIAALAQLPPPPPPPALTPGSGPLPSLARAPRSTSGRSGDLRRAPDTPSRMKGPRAPTAPSDRRSQTSSRPAARTERPDAGLEAALAAVSRWQSSSDGRSGSGEAGWPAPQKPEAEQLALWSRLWEKANPDATGDGLSRRLPVGAELRRLDANDSAVEPLPAGRRLTLALGDRWLLIWSAGGEIWLLQAPASRPEIDGDRQ